MSFSAHYFICDFIFTKHGLAEGKEPGNNKYIHIAWIQTYLQSVRTFQSKEGFVISGIIKRIADCEIPSL